MGRFLALTSSIISLFTLSWVLCRWLQPVQCINSSLVSKVVLASGETAVQQCSPSARLFGAKISPIAVKARLPERLENLQRIVPLLTQVTPIEVHITRHLKRQLLITPGRVDISADFLMKPKLFERALMFAQFSHESDFAAAVKSEFLLDETLWGVTEPSADAGAASSWVEHMKGLGNYCHSHSVIVAHITYCDVHNQYGDSAISDSKLGPTPWGLAPIFVRSLEGAYAHLNLAGKERLLQDLLFLDEPEDQTIADLTHAKTFTEANAQFAELMRNWLMPLMLKPSIVSTVINSATLPAASPVRYIVIDRSALDVFPIDQVETGILPSPSILTLVEYGLRQYVVPGDITYRFDRAELLKRHDVRRIVYVSCHIPSVDNLLRFGEDDNVKRVLYVRQCASDDMNWSRALTVGLDRYLTNHAETQFMEFNLSALRLAQRQRGPLKDASEISNWGKWLKWQNVVTDDESPSALRPLAVIEGVRRFRMF